MLSNLFRTIETLCPDTHSQKHGHRIFMQKSYFFDFFQTEMILRQTKARFTRELRDYRGFPVVATYHLIYT